jgi:5'-nucleotidase / UDP-sugar diphosphatase
MRRTFLNGFFLFLVACVLFSNLIYANETTSLTILYTNDIHAQFDPIQAVWLKDKPRIGGFAYITTLIKQNRARAGNSVLLSAGDVMTGPPVSRLTKGEAIFDLLNLMGYDAMCLGNHEFDQGWENTVKRINQADFPVLAANIFYKGTDIPFAMPCTILNRGGIRIGIIGILGRTAAIETINKRLVKPLEFRDQIAVLQEWVPKLRPHVDILILLAHEGKAGMQSANAEGDPQRKLTKDIQVAATVPGIDVLITGHAHRGVETPIVVPETGTLIVSTYGLGTRLGRLVLNLDMKTHHIVDYKGVLIPVLSDKIQPDKEAQARITKWEQKVKAITGEVIGTADMDLLRDYYRESPLGDLAADAYRKAAETDISMTNAGGLRADIPAGPITVGQILAMYPFENPIVRMSVTGNEIIQMLEHGASLEYGMAQISGLSCTIDLSRPVGHRVVSASVAGKTVRPDRTYTLATSDYLADGGDGYTMLRSGRNVKSAGVFCTQAIIQFIREHRHIRYQELNRVRVLKALSPVAHGSGK